MKKWTPACDGDHFRGEFDMLNGTKVYRREYGGIVWKIDDVLLRLSERWKVCVPLLLLHCSTHIYLHRDPREKGWERKREAIAFGEGGVRGIEKERGDGGGTARSRDVLCSTNTRKWLFKRWATSPPTAQWFLKSIRAVCADLRTRKLLRGDRSWGAITGSWSHIAQHPAGVCGGVCAYTPHHSTINPFRRNTCTGH